MKYNQQWIAKFLFIVSSLLLSVGCNQLARAQDTPTIPIFPKYMVVGVVYAPPGASSYVKYSNSSFVGASDSVQTTSTTQVISSKAVTNKAFFGIFGSSTTTTNSDEWTYQNQNTASMQVLSTTGNSVSTMGPISSALGINHDNDVIYIWLNPVDLYVVNAHPPSGQSPLNWTGIASNGCDLTDPSDPVSIYQTASGCDPNQYPYPDIVGIPVWCLKNPYSPYQGCAQWIQYTSRSWDTSGWPLDPATDQPTGPGLTLADYADILRADPFVQLNGQTPNPCHPTYGVSIDPNRPEPALPNPIPLNGVQAAFWINPPAMPTSCGVSSNNSKRFLPIGEIEFPVPGPNGLPSTYQGTLQYQSTSQQTNVSTDTHTTSYSKATEKSIGTEGATAVIGAAVAAGFQTVTGAVVGAAISSLFSFGTSTTNTNGNTSTWQQQTSASVTSGTTDEADYVITGPQLSDNYTGPATFNVYQDNVYGTFAFYSPLEPKINLGTICINGCSSASSFNWSTPVQVGMQSTSQRVVLTNNSIYPMTMTAPAATFSDPGFSVNPTTDHCSNVVLTPGLTLAGTPTGDPLATCPIDIIFSPVPSDALQSRTPIYASMIAAGTENASISTSAATNPTTQDVLVVAEALVSGIASPNPNNLQGATLTNSNQNYGDPYEFPLLTVDHQSETYTFTSLYSQGVTLQNGPQGNIGSLQDTDDFQIPAATNTCSTSMIYHYGEFCQFVVQYQAKYNNGLLSHSGSVTVIGSPVISAGTPVPLVSRTFQGSDPSGFIGPEPGQSLNFVGTTCYSNCFPYPLTGSLQVTNTTSWPMYQLVVYADPTVDLSGCPAVLQPNQGCTVNFTYEVEPGGGFPGYTDPITIQGLISHDGGVTGTIYTNTDSSTYIELDDNQDNNDGYTVTNPNPSGTGPVVAAGGVAKYSFQLAPTGKTYLNSITFSVSGLPNGATAGFDPASIGKTDGPQAVNLSIQTAKSTAVMTHQPFMNDRSLVYLSLFLITPVLIRKRKKAGKFLSLSGFAILLSAGLLTTLTGCGSASPPSNANSSMTYNIVVTIHSGSTQQSFTLPLTIH